MNERAQQTTLCHFLACIVFVSKLLNMKAFSSKNSTSGALTNTLRIGNHSDFSTYHCICLSIYCKKIQFDRVVTIWLRFIVLPSSIRPILNKNLNDSRIWIFQLQSKPVHMLQFIFQFVIPNVESAFSNITVYWL